MENKTLLLKSAMFYGLFLGGFWVLKYVFFIIGARHPVLLSVYWILTSLTIVFAYVFTRVYKMLIGGRIGFFHAWQFGILLYLFSALIVSLLHYVFYRYLAPPDYIARMMDIALSLVREMNLNPQMEDTFGQMPEVTPIRLTIQGIFNNIFYGLILSVPVAAILYRKPTEGFSFNQEEKNQKPNQ
ncbi:MAG: DUF4199 domain-containing protein [Tannerellaceae bacterium]|nr:DUF4199 domain-containing protein [Tannerellaceae bacterium]